MRPAAIIGSVPGWSSAKLTEARDASRSVLWAVAAAGSVFNLTAVGQRTDRPLPFGWRGLHIRVSGGGTVWVTASARGGDYGIFKMIDASGPWMRAFGAGKPLKIAGAAGPGVWMLQEGQLRLLDVQGQDTTIQLHFEPADVSQGADGTLWAIGGERRFGGSAVWRYEHSRQRWFQLPPPAAAKKVSGAPDGTAWSVSSRGDLWRLHPEGIGKFRECSANPGCANCLYSPKRMHVSDVSVGADGVVWFVGGGSSSNRRVVGRIIDFRTRSTANFHQDDDIVSIAAGAAQASD